MTHPISPPRLVAGIVLALAVLGFFFGPTLAQEEQKKDEPKKEAVEPKKEEPKAPDAAQIRKQIDDLIAEMGKSQIEFQRKIAELRRQMPRPTPPGFVAQVRPQGRFGVMVDAPSEAMADQLGLEKGKCMVVLRVSPDSAAAKAGLKAHDVLVEFDGKPVSSDIGEFVRMVNDAKTGAAIDVVVIRKGKRETLKGITLPEAPARPPVRF